MKKKLFIIIGVIVVIVITILSSLYMFTEVFGKKVVPVKINSIELQYVPSNNLDFNKKYLDTVKLKLNGDDLKSIKSTIRTLHKSDKKYKDITGKYRIVIDKDCEIVMNDKEMYVIRDKKKNVLQMSNLLYDKVHDIVSKNNKKLYNSLKFKDITIKKNGASIPVKNEYNIKLLKNHINYLEIKLDEEDLKTIGDEKIKIITDEYSISIFDNNVAGITNVKKGDAVVGIIDEDLVNICNSIYDSSTK